MAERQYKYTAKIKQPQTVGNVKLDPKGGKLSEREYKTLKKDVYGASLLEKGLLVVEEVSASEPAPSGNTGDTGDESGGKAGNKDKPEDEEEEIPDFDGSNENSSVYAKGYENGKDKPESHAGWKPE
jgi:hypothetical protein